CLFMLMLNLFQLCLGELEGPLVIRPRCQSERDLRVLIYIGTYVLRKVWLVAGCPDDHAIHTEGNPHVEVLALLVCLDRVVPLHVRPLDGHSLTSDRLP